MEKLTPEEIQLAIDAIHIAIVYDKGMPVLTRVKFRNLIIKLQHLKMKVWEWKA